MVTVTLMLVFCSVFFQSVEAFIKDFTPKAKYKAAYVYFTDCKWDRAGRVSDDYLCTCLAQGMGKRCMDAFNE